VQRVRAQTVQTELHLDRTKARLEKAGALSFDEAVHHMREIQNFLATCVSCGCVNELRAVMERAQLGDMVDALLAGTSTRSA
jgi:hypothetical protein